MLTVLLVVFLVVLAAVFFLWLLRTMMQVSCPECLKEHKTKEVIIPVIPGFRWFCPRCQGLFLHKDIMQQINHNPEGE